MTDEYYTEEGYRGQLDAEGLLIMQMNRISMYRDSDIKRYCSSIETLIIISPKKVREKALTKIRELGLQRGRYQTITEERLVLYDDLWIYVNELLETKEKMIWKKKTTKTYE